MTASRIAALVVLVVVGGGIFVPVAGANGAASDAGGTADENPNETSMGAEVSTFMHSSAAGLDEAVDDGMFDATYERVDEEERRDVVTDRTDHLRERLDALEDEREALEANEDELSTPVYDARMTRLTVEISALERSIDKTESRAVEVGVDTTEIEALRADTAALAGPDVARVAAGIVGLDPSSSLFSDWPVDDGDGSTGTSDGTDVATDDETTDGDDTSGD